MGRKKVSVDTYDAPLLLLTAAWLELMPTTLPMGTGNKAYVDMSFTIAFECCFGGKGNTFAAKIASIKCVLG